MENNEIQNKVDELIDKIKKAEKELELIRKECSHKEVEIKSVPSKNGGASEIRKVCKKCKKITGYPTQTEIQNQLK